MITILISGAVAFVFYRATRFMSKSACGYLVACLVFVLLVLIKRLTT